MFAASSSGIEQPLPPAKKNNRDKSNNHKSNVQDVTKLLDLHCVRSIYRNQLKLGSTFKTLNNDVKKNKLSDEKVLTLPQPA